MCPTANIGFAPWGLELEVCVVAIKFVFVGGWFGWVGGGVELVGFWCFWLFFVVFWGFLVALAR